MPATIIVTGLSRIDRDLQKSVPGVQQALRAGLKIAAEPVAKTAEAYSLGRIRKMPRSPRWAVTRIGTTRSGVYIVPKERGVKARNPFDPRRRPNLVALMMGRSFEPALEASAPVVEAIVTQLVDEVTSKVA